MFQYQLNAEANKALIAIVGDIDIDGTELMEDEILPALMAYDAATIDMSEVYFVDSSGIGLLIKLVQTLQESDKIVKIKDVRPEVNEVFELLHIQDILGEEVFS
ncbi:STAS domain-containing protein [Paenibacillus xanthanilyticus]|uniref:STAS domain-containing protein n=1 Tax=Paenibacillus xanthanilyticus TaxID=1783531 RepID=A0ABV8K1R7_9BACL